MSLVSLTINHNFPVINRHKWWSRHASARSNLFSDNRYRLTNTQTSLLRLNSIIAIPVLTKAPSNITRATPRDTSIKLEKIRKGSFWVRRWDPLDIAMLCMVGTIHALGACAPFVFSWDAFFMALIMSFLNGFGVVLGYHRLLCHRSFKIPKWLEYFFVYCGTHAFLKDPIFWVSTHKHHHKYADTERDPSTPSEGFWFSYMGWFLYNDYLAAKCGESRVGEYSNVPELKAQWFYRSLHETYFWHLIALGTILYLYGGFSYLAWGMGMRGVLVFQIANIMIAVCHTWGERPWNTPDTSTNNWWMAMLTLGEGWHNNHHAFPKSARHGLEDWQFDLTWELIKFLEMVGLATDVKLPTESDKRRKAILLGQIQTENKDTTS